MREQHCTLPCGVDADDFDLLSLVQVNTARYLEYFPKCYVLIRSLVGHRSILASLIRDRLLELTISTECTGLRVF